MFIAASDLEARRQNSLSSIPEEINLSLIVSLSSSYSPPLSSFLSLLGA